MRIRSYFTATANCYNATVLYIDVDNICALSPSIKIALYTGSWST